MKRLFAVLVSVFVVGGVGALSPSGAAAAVQVHAPAGELLEGVRYELRIVNTEAAGVELEGSAAFPGQFGALSKKSKGSTWSLFETTCPICILPGQECGQPVGYLGGQPASVTWKVKYKTPCLGETEAQEEEKEGKKGKTKQKKGKGGTRFG